MDKKKVISNKLQNGKGENPFSVPQNYFDDFQQRLQEKVNAEKKIFLHKKQPLLVTRLVWVSAVAAVFVVAFFISRNIIGIGADRPLSQDEIAYAFEQEILDLDELELLENINEMNQNKESGNGYSEEIIMYLLDEDIEIDIIVNEL